MSTARPHRAERGPSTPDPGRRPRDGLLRLRAVLRPALLAPRHAARVERTAYDVIAHPRQVLHAPAPDQDDRGLLQIVSLTGDVARHLHAVREPNSRDLAQRGIRLLGRGGVHARALSPLLWTRPQRRRAGLAPYSPPPEADELAQSRHRFPPNSC